MRLKNYQEDVVMHAIEIALEDKPELREDEVAVKDIAAYALNRLQPRYIMSERGFTRLAAEQLELEAHTEGMANMIGVLMLVNKGIELIEGRRKPGNGHHLGGVAPQEALLPVHNYPQVVGKVIDAETKEPIPNATVTLYLDGARAASADPGWTNPFVTSAKAYGYFSFWPEAVRDEAAERVSTLNLRIEHPQYRTMSLTKEVTTRAEFEVRDEIDSESIVRIPPAQLMVGEGSAAETDH
jgi:competence protein ComFB